MGGWETGAAGTAVVETDQWMNVLHWVEEERNQPHHEDQWRRSMDSLDRPGSREPAWTGDGWKRKAESQKGSS